MPTWQQGAGDGVVEAVTCLNGSVVIHLHHVSCVQRRTDAILGEQLEVSLRQFQVRCAELQELFAVRHPHDNLPDWLGVPDA